MSEEKTTTETPPLTPSFPPSRVKKIVKIDKDITRVTSEALYLISGAAELFLHFLAEKSSVIAAEKKRKTIKVEDLRVAVKRHAPSREFLFDSLPVESQPSDGVKVDRTVKKKAPPPHTRRIDSFFKKPAIKDSLTVDDVVDDDEVDEVVVDRVEVVEDVITEQIEDADDVVHVDED
ncbi:hypothetical protein vseg_002222 [Gypsophila vaccaria]